LAFLYLDEHVRGEAMCLAVHRVGRPDCILWPRVKGVKRVELPSAGAV
jgi:hypothetical protein